MCSGTYCTFHTVQLPPPLFMGFLPGAPEDKGSHRFSRPRVQPAEHLPLASAGFRVKSGGLPPSHDFQFGAAPAGFHMPLDCQEALGRSWAWEPPARHPQGLGPRSAHGRLYILATWVSLWQMRLRHAALSKIRIGRSKQQEEGTAYSCCTKHLPALACLALSVSVLRPAFCFLFPADSEQADVARMLYKDTCHEVRGVRPVGAQSSALRVPCARPEASQQGHRAPFLSRFAGADPSS